MNLRTCFYCLVAAVIIFGLVSCGNDTSESKSDTPRVDSSPVKVKERFQLYDIDGHLRNWSEFSGKPFIMNFWATWCGPCRREIPILEQLYERFHPLGLEVVGISVDKAGAPVKSFAEKLKIPYPVLYANIDVAREFDIAQSIPFTIFFYPDGTESTRLIGLHPEESLRQEIAKIMAAYHQPTNGQ